MAYKIYSKYKWETKYGQYDRKKYLTKEQATTAIKKNIKFHNLSAKKGKFRSAVKGMNYQIRKVASPKKRSGSWF